MNIRSRIYDRLVAVSVMVLLTLATIFTGCNKRPEQRLRPVFVDHLTPASAMVEFAPTKKLGKVPLHIDNRKMRIWNSAYLPYGTELDSAYLRLVLSNQLSVTIINEHTGKAVQNWHSTDTSKIDVTGGKLKLIIAKQDAPTITYDLRLLTYGYNPKKFTWEKLDATLPVASDDATVLEANGNTYWLTKNSSTKALELYQLIPTTLTFTKVPSANVPQALIPSSLLKDGHNTYWGLTEAGKLWHTSNLTEWQEVPLGDVLLSQLIGEGGKEGVVLWAIGYEQTAPTEYYSYTIQNGQAKQGEKVPADFPVKGAYVFTYQIEGNNFANTLLGTNSAGDYTADDFFTADGTNWGKAPYKNADNRNLLPVKGGLYLNPHDNRTLYVIGGLNRSNEPSNKILASTDRGSTWQELTKEFAPGVEFAARYGASGIVHTAPHTTFPTFYIFGGNVNGVPTTEIWKGWLDTTGGIINSFE